MAPTMMEGLSHSGDMTMRSGSATRWRSAGLATAALCIVLAYSGASEAGAAMAVIYTIPGNQAWTDTGVDVRAGDYIGIKASGRWCWGPAPGDCTGPNGSAASGGVMRLHMKVGASGTDHAIGARLYPWDPRAHGTAGRIFLGPQDSFVGDNSGSVNATIVVFTHRVRRMVPGTSAKFATGIKVRKHDFIAVKASGKWSWGPAVGDWTTPKGGAGGAMRLKGIVEHTTRGAGSELDIGKKFMRKARWTGRLYLYGKDSHHGDNEGEANVKIWY